MPTQDAKPQDYWSLKRAWAGPILTGILALFALGAIWLDAVSGSYSPQPPSLFLSLSLLAAVYLLASAPNLPDGPSPWAVEACTIVLSFLAAILLTATLGYVWVVIASGVPGGPFLTGSVTAGSAKQSIFPGPTFITTTSAAVEGQTSSAQLAQVIMSLAGGAPAAMAFWWALCKLKEIGAEWKGWLAGALGIVLIMILSLVSAHQGPNSLPMPMQGVPGSSQPQKQGSSGSGFVPPGFGGFSTSHQPDNNTVTPY